MKRLSAEAMAEGRRLLEAATDHPRPWKLDVSKYGDEQALCAITNAKGYEAITCDSGVYGPGVKVGAMLVWAVNNLPALLKAAERQSAMEAALQIANRSVRYWMDKYKRETGADDVGDTVLGDIDRIIDGEKP